jgi:methionine-rich copper-binding protein CopC
MRFTPLIAFVLGAAAQPALAHTELAESVPSDGAVLETAPEQVTLRFSEPVRLTALSVQKDDAGKQSLGPLPSDSADRFVVAAPALENGHYTMSWRALSADTHVMTGELRFVVGGTSDRAGHTNSAPAPEHAAH